MKVKNFFVFHWILIFSFFVFTFFISCSHLEKDLLVEKSEKGKNHLKQSDAERRAQVLSQIQYQLFLNLDKKNLHYEGVVEINFQWKKNKNFLRIDFFNGVIDQLTVNSKNLIHKDPSVPQGQKIDSYKKREKKAEKVEGLYKYNGQALFLSPLLLVPGENYIRIHFNKSYSRGGYGLNRFEDPKDKRVYLSTHFEPYGANEFFPLFDQPDLKATFTLKVKAPQGWNLVSTMREYKIERLKSGKKLWHFPKSFVLSSYAFSFYGGPFQVWESDYKNIHLRIFSRKSVSKFVYPKKWFRLTQKGFKFFEEYFGIPYPYSKYDQLIVPELMFGGMENVAAPSFNELFLFKDSIINKEKLAKLAMVLFHELSHMWFGNLVTMKWWNDLWLNESFATYISIFGLSRVLKNELPWEIWDWFYFLKTSTYFIDDSDFTHPVIPSDVRDTHQALATFDFISYYKGAANLRQLHHWIGEKAFRKGIRNYLLNFSYKNTSWEDLFDAFSLNHEKSIKKWSRKWLKTSGFNEIQADFKCENKKISNFFLRQSVYTGDKELRPHQLILALFKFNQEKTQLKKVKELPVRIEGSQVILDSLKGFDCPDLVYPNWKGQSYVRVRLDAKSFKNAFTSMDKISSSSLRLFVLYSVWNSLMEGKVSLFSYSDFILERLENEEDRLLLKVLYNVSSVYYYYPRESEKEKFFNLASKVEHILWKRLKASKNLEEKIFWRDFFITRAWTPYALNRLHGLLKKKIRLQGLPLKSSHVRWSIIQRLSQFQFQDVDVLISEEFKKDSSYEGRLGWIASRVLKPSLENKRYWLSQVFDERSSFSYMEKSTIIKSLYPLSQDHLRTSYTKSFFNDFLKIRQKEKTLLSSLPLIYLSPSFCEKKFISKIERFTKAHRSQMNVLDQKDFHFLLKTMKQCLKIRSNL